MALKMEKVCPACGKSFTTTRKNKKFCSRDCCRRFYRKHPKTAGEAPEGTTVLRTFQCGKCGRMVYITESSDRRTRFCSSHCERLYWKHSKEKIPGLRLVVQQSNK